MQILADRQAIPVVILCGGTGTRLREETEFKPKPMVEIGGRPIVWHIMKAYAHHGYKNFILCLGYKGHYIKDYFLKHQLLMHDFELDFATNSTKFLETDGKDDFKVTFADTGLETMTGERLLKVAKYLEPYDSFMLTYGDGVSDIDIKALHDFHEARAKSHGAAVTLTGIHPKSKYGLVNHDDNQMVTQFQQYPRLADYTNGGFMVMDKSFLNYCQPGQMVEDALIAASADKKVAMYQHQGFWHAMDTIKDKEDLEKMWKNGAEWKVWG